MMNEVTSIFSCKLPSWFNLPLKRKRVDNESLQRPPKKQKIRQSDKENVHDSRKPDQKDIKSTHRFYMRQEAVDPTLGQFTSLPIELLHIIYQLLDVNSLVAMAAVSKAFNFSILDYLMSTPGFAHLLSNKATTTSSFTTVIRDNPALFKDAGSVLCSVTINYSIAKRLKILSQVKEKIDLHSSTFISTVTTSPWCQCFGQFFSSYVRKWSDLDKKKGYCVFVKTTKLEQKIDRILRYSPGTLLWHERKLRELVLHTLLSPTGSINDREYGFWLTLILRPLPITHQARLLYVLTGPIDHSGTVCWNCTCGCVTESSRQQQQLRTWRESYDNANYNLSETARAFRILLTHCKHDWSLDGIISIFNELTMMPCGWSLEKVASLLVSSGDALCRAIMSNKALNGHVEELSLMLYHVGYCCLTSKNSTLQGCKNVTTKTTSDWYIDMLRFTVQQVADPQAKKRLISSLFTVWHDYCLFERHTSTETDSHDLLASLATMVKLSKAIVEKFLKL